MFLSLPVEILKNVLEYSNLGDKLSVALCNREHYNVIKPLLWTRVKLMQEHIMSPHIDPRTLENLQHTQELYLCANFTLSSISESIHFGFNVSSVLNALNTVKLNSLILHGSFDGTVLHTVKRYSCLQHLELKGIRHAEESTWNNVSFPHTLKSLSLISCPISVEFMRSVIEKYKKLEGLIIVKSKLTNQCLVNISQAKGLKSLVLGKIGKNGAEHFDVSSLNGLQQLKILQLGCIGIAEGSFRKLCEGLPQLESLQLFCMELTDGELGGLHLLQCLTEFSVAECNGITGSAFIARVCSLPALKKLEFDVSLFSEIDDFDDLHGMLSPLNNVSSLKQISISIDERKHPKCCLLILSALCWGDKKTWSVTVSDNTNEDRKIFTLHKNILSSIS